MSIQFTYKSVMTVIEQLEANPDGLSATDRQVTYDAFNQSKSLSAGTTPPVTMAGFFKKALVAGVGTIDLTAFPTTNGAVDNGTGLKAQGWKFRNPPTNTGPITVTFGAANPYLLRGAGWKMIIQPGQEDMGYGADLTPDVGPTSKNIDISGTGTESLEVSLVLG